MLPLFGAAASALRLLQPDGSLAEVAWAGEAREHFRPGHAEPPGIGVTGRAVREGRPVWTRDVLADSKIVLTEKLRAHNAAGGFHGTLAVPLRVRGRAIGALTIADRRVRSFSEPEVALLQAFGDQAALSLENARLYQEAARGRREAEVIAALARDLNASLDPEAAGCRQHAQSLERP